MLADLKQMAERCLARTPIMCRHQSGKHIWNAHRDCQWCHTSQERYEAAVVAEAYLALATGKRLYKNLRPGDHFVADMGSGCNKDEIFVVKEIYHGKDVWDKPVINIDTTCNEGLTFGADDGFSLAELNRLTGLEEEAHRNLSQSVSASEYRQMGG